MASPSVTLQPAKALVAPTADVLPLSLLCAIPVIALLVFIIYLQQQELSKATATGQCDTSTTRLSRDRQRSSGTKYDPVAEISSPVAQPDRVRSVNSNQTPFQIDPTDPDSVYKNIRPIGYVKSPFSKRALTPRQSQMAQVTSTIQFRKEIQPQHAFQGLEEYSHCWVVFTFHANTNLTQEKRYIKTLITPPRSPDKKYGIYATRTPHRHNNMGLSLAKIVSIDYNKGILTCTGLDLIDGTPVLDIKPIHPTEERLFANPEAELQYPEFVVNELDHTVIWDDDCRAQLQTWASHKKIPRYPSLTADDFVTNLTAILRQQDPRSSWYKQLNGNFFVEFYGINVTLNFDIPNNTIYVKKVEIMTNP